VLIRVYSWFNEKDYGEKTQQILQDKDVGAQP